MAGDSLPFEFSAEMQAATQAVALLALSWDLVECERRAAVLAPEDRHAARTSQDARLEHATSFRTELVAFMKAAGLASARDDESSWATYPTVESLEAYAQAVLSGVGNRLGLQDIALVAVETATGNYLPPGQRWCGDVEAAIASGLQKLDPAFSRDAVDAIRRAHRRHVGRLTRSSVSPYALGALALGGVGASLITAGTLAPALGTAIGGAMGLSGAAATSAGLAFLGGGSLASGGFGMAGGILLVSVAGKAAYAGMRYAATSVAVHDRKQFIFELARLHTAYRMVERTPENESAILRALNQMFDEIRELSNEPISRASVDRRDWLASWRDATNWERIKEAAASTSEANKYAAAERVIRAEIAQIQNPVAATISVSGIFSLVNPADLYEVLAS